MQLNRTPNALTKTDRDNLNKNWTALEEEINRLGSAPALAQLAKLAADNVQAQMNALVVQGDSSPQAIQASVGADGKSYGGNLKARLDAEKNETDKNLAEKAKKTEVRLKSESVGLNDAAPDLLAAIQDGGGSTFELLSIPRDGSVTAGKTDFFNVYKNLYNVNSPSNIIGKGFSGSTNTVVDAVRYNITHEISAKAGERIFISDNGVEVTDIAFYKIVSLNSAGGFINNLTYTLGGTILPVGTNSIKVQIDNLKTRLQIEKSGVTAYMAFTIPKIKEEVIPDFEQSKIKNLKVSPAETTFIRPGKNLFNPADPAQLSGKGFSGFTNTVVDSAIHNITGYMAGLEGNRVLISKDGIEVANPKTYKVAAYNATGNFLTNQEYALGGVILPLTTKIFRVHYDNTNLKMQIEIGASVTPYSTHGNFIAKEFLSPELLESNKKGNLNGLKFASFGDSLAFRNKWQPYVAEFFGMTHTNLGIGSTTLAYVAEYESMLPSFTNQARIDAIKASDPDVLTIQGGANDRHRNVPIGTSNEFAKPLAEKDKTLFIGAYSYLVETLLTWKPTLKILLLTTTQAGPQWNYDYSPYADATKVVAKNYALRCVDLYSYSGISKFNSAAYTIDGLHQNDLGGKNVANLVVHEFKSMSYI